jgi:Domain of unknown function (DUF4159)
VQQDVSTSGAHKVRKPDVSAVARGTNVEAETTDYNTRMERRHRITRLSATIAIVAVCAAVTSAQFRRGRFFEPVRSATPESFDGGFNFCRIMFARAPDGDGGNWAVDYPRADVNLSIRFAELTKAHISTDSTGEPNHLVFSLTDPLMFDCPFIMMTEVGSAYISPEEAAKLREYLEKGGFLWADDFWGSYAWEHWVSEFRKVLPATEYPIFELPKDHPLFKSQFVITKVPQIPSINHWMGSGGGTSERYEDSAVPHAMAVADRKGRVMVLMTHNTDFGDSWEREGDDPNYFYNFSVDGYAFGIDVLLYALSH